MVLFDFNSQLKPNKKEATMYDKNIYQTLKEKENLGTIQLFFRLFTLGSLMNKANIKNTTGASPLELFTIIFDLCFKGQNLFQGVIRNNMIQLNKRHIYDFLNNPNYNWRKLLFLLSAKIYVAFKPLNSNPDEEVLIVDDSLYDRNRSKKVELLSKVYDHCTHKYVKGFRMLTLGWSDGISFQGLDFSLLSSKDEKKRYQQINQSIDKRTCGAKRRSEAVQKATDHLSAMVKRAKFFTGIKAKYLLMDSWFCFPCIIHQLKTQIDVICAAKDIPKILYTYKGRKYRLSGLYSVLKKNKGKAPVIASCIVTTSLGDKVKIVFVSATKKRGWLALLCSDTSLDANEIIRLYGKRWDIEVFFKMCKQHLKLAKEVQLRNYDGLIAHTTIVFIRYNFLSYQRRMEDDLRSYSEAFRLCFDEMSNLSFLDALNRILASIMTFFTKSNKFLEDIVSQILSTVFLSTIQFFKLKPT